MNTQPPVNISSTMKPRTARVIIAGGGTGGHIFPAIAIANALKKIKPGIEILFIGANGKMEMEKVPQAGYMIRGLDIAGFNRSSLIKNIALPYKLLKSFFQVQTIFREFKPDAAVGVGGYSTYPVLKLAQVKGIPTFIHESNSFAGKANMMLGKKATGVFVATRGMEKFFPPGKLTITGNPVRPAIAEEAMILKDEALAFFGLEKSGKTILVIGGSLGARSVNEAIDAGLDKILNMGLQLIWQTGKPYAATAAEKTEGKKGVWTGDFISKMEMAYAAADVVVSRAGAMSIAELCLVQKPVIFVPYPYAAEDHQTANARLLYSDQAALMVADRDAAEKLVQEILNLMENEEKQKELSNNIAKHAVWNADERIAAAIGKELP